MSRSVIYQRYTISSVSTPNTETGQWQLRISISVEEDGATKSIPYWMPLEYATEAEADIHGITLARRLLTAKFLGFYRGMNKNNWRGARVAESSRRSYAAVRNPGP
jgi:hypothetical protein